MVKLFQINRIYFIFIHGTNLFVLNALKVESCKFLRYAHFNLDLVKLHINSKNIFYLQVYTLNL